MEELFTVSILLDDNEEVIEYYKKLSDAEKRVIEVFSNNFFISKTFSPMYTRHIPTSRVKEIIITA